MSDTPNRHVLQNTPAATVRIRMAPDRLAIGEHLPGHEYEVESHVAADRVRRGRATLVHETDRAKLPTSVHERYGKWS